VAESVIKQVQNGEIFLALKKKQVLMEGHRISPNY